MAIFTLGVIKVAITNEAKTRGISVEIPQDMGWGELLDRIEEFRKDIKKRIEETEKEKEDKDSLTEEQFQKACAEGTVVKNIGD